MTEPIPETPTKQAIKDVRMGEAITAEIDLDRWGLTHEQARAIGYKIRSIPNKDVAKLLGVSMETIEKWTHDENWIRAFVVVARAEVGIRNIGKAIENVTATIHGTGKKASDWDKWILEMTGVVGRQIELAPMKKIEVKPLFKVQKPAETG